MHLYIQLKISQPGTGPSCVSYASPRSDTTVSDLNNISYMRILFDAYQYDTDEMQIKFIHRS
jgi:hypothetical protein